MKVKSTVDEATISIVNSSAKFKVST